MNMGYPQYGFFAWLFFVLASQAIGQTDAGPQEFISCDVVVKEEVERHYYLSVLVEDKTKKYVVISEDFQGAAPVIFQQSILIKVKGPTLVFLSDDFRLELSDMVQDAGTKIFGGYLAFRINSDWVISEDLTCSTGLQPFDIAIDGISF